MPWGASTLEASGITAGERREKVQAKADALLADPRVRVWYDPQKPWVCSIRRARFSGAAVLFLASLFLLWMVRLMLSK